MSSAPPSEIRGLDLKDTEACFLAGLLGAQALWGIDDPFRGWLTEEIQEEFGRIGERLLERGLIRTSEDAQVVVAEAVAELMGAWAFADSSFAVSRTSAEGTGQIRFFHLAANRSVQRSMGSNGSSLLVPLPGPHQVHEVITRTLGVTEQPAAPAGTVRTRELDLSAARKAAIGSGAEAGAALLRGRGVEAGAAQHLAQALAMPTANATLIAVSRKGNDWEVDGFGLLEGRDGIWLLRALNYSDDNWVEATPRSAGDIKEEVQQLMDRLVATGV